MAGDGISSMAGMSKNQLYDIMCQMKALVEQNQQQAKQILVQNPNLTRALFQAQIMLGMLQPPQLVQIPNAEPAEVQPVLRPSSQTSHSLPHSMPVGPVQVSSQDAGAYQTQVPFGNQQQNQPFLPVTSRTAPPVNVQSPPMPSRVSHSTPPPRGNVQTAQPSLPQSSHFTDLPPLHSGSQSFPPHQPQMSNSSLSSSAMQHLPTQPPLPQQPRPTSIPAFHHQLPTQMGPNTGFQHPGPPQMHHSQPTMFHSGGQIPQNSGPPFSQGLSTPLNQPPPQSGYPAVGSHMARDFNTSTGNFMHIEREAPWMPGPPETTTRLPLPPPPPVPNQMPPGNQLPRPPPLSAEMERSLVQQVMSLTPEQINLLPPEQRNQVFQLQQMLR